MQFSPDKVFERQVEKIWEDLDKTPKYTNRISHCSEVFECSVITWIHQISYLRKVEADEYNGER